MTSVADPDALASYVPTLLLRCLPGGATPPASAFRKRFRAAVLFADISGFTALAEELAAEGSAGAERLAGVLNGVFGELIGLVGERGGEVVKLPGDAVLAAWPTRADEDAPEAARRAAECALLARVLVAARAREIGRAIRLRLGLADGDAWVSVLGGLGERWHVLVGGPSVVEASRAARLAAEDEVVASAGAWSLLRDAAEGSVLEGGAVRLARLDVSTDPSPRGLSSPPFAVASEVLRGFVPRAVLRRLELGREEWFAEFRRVTAAFVRLPGFAIDAPDGLARLQTAVLGIQDAVERYGGEITELLAEPDGTTLVAAWGIPAATHDDDAVRALEAVRAVKAALASVAPECRIGVATGRLFCGSRGSAARREYAMIGSRVVLAARLMQSGAADVVCDLPTRDAARGRIVFEPLPPLLVKGRERPVTAFRPLAREHGALRVRGSLVGRGAERAFLAERIDALASSRAGGWIVVEGEAGIGKSRLIEDLLDQAERRGVHARVGSGDAIERGTPYHAFRSILASLFDLKPGADRATQRACVLQRLAAHPDLAPRAPLLSSILSLEMEDSEATRGLTGQARAEAIGEVVARLLAEAARREPTLLVLEDAHWLDSASWAVALAVQRHAAPLLAVVAMRPSADPAAADLLAAPSVSRLRLAALGPQETLDLARARLGVEHLPEPVQAWIRERGAGHPFFTEELAYALRDTGVLVIEDGRASLARAFDDLRGLDLPDTVEGVIASRIDRLSPRERLTVKLASVIGPSFPMRLLREIHPLDADPGAIDADLDGLARMGLIERGSAGDEPTGAFKHVLIQGSAYASIPFAQRRQLHRRVAEWIERDPATDSERADSVLAHHWREADEPEKACRHAELAGDRALRSGAHREAASYFAAALGLLAAEPARVGPHADRRRVAHWKRQLGIALYALGEIPASRAELLDSLEALGVSAPRSLGGWWRALASHGVRQLGHRLLPGLLPRRAALADASAACAWLAEEAFFGRDPVAMFAASLMAVNLGERAGGAPHLARSYSMLSVVFGAWRMPRLAVLYNRLALEAAARADDLAGRVYAGYARCVSLIGVGRFAEAEDEVRAVLGPARRLGDRQEIEITDAALANLEYVTGRFEASRQRFAAIRDSARARGNRLREAWALYGGARSTLVLGRLDEAEGQLRLALALLERAPDGVSELICHGLLGEVHLARGDLDRARAEADAAEALIRGSMPSLFTEREGYGGVAEVRLALLGRAGGRRDAAGAQARAAARRSVSALRLYALVFPVGAPRALLARGRLHAALGRRARALRVLSRALATASRLGMPFDEALVRREIARCLPAGSAAREEQRAAARALFERLGCTIHLAGLDAERACAGRPRPEEDGP